MSKSIALIGNPNCGKTTLFNRLTGANQWIGNWPGVTVEKHQGSYSDPKTQAVVNVIDLPGCYSLVATKYMALDEKIACEYIQTATNTLYINVIDVTHLARDLYLSMQLLEMGLPLIIALNCMDLVKSAGIEIDVLGLQKALGCPIVPIIAKTGKGVDCLQDAINNYQPQQPFEFLIEPVLQKGINALCKYYNPGQNLRILEGDDLLAASLIAQNIDVEVVRQEVQAQLPEDLDIYVARMRRKRLDTILQKTFRQNVARVSLSAKIDNIVLHKIFGPMIFLAVMYVMFTCAINLGGMLQVGFEQASETFFVTKMQAWLSMLHTPPLLINLLTEGLGRGISITITFMPVLSAMFLCLGILETSGYMTRAAFIIDRVMRQLGLSGRAFVPMIVGFGCNVPAVMGARTLADKRERILTIMMTPFMSCSARLAIYAIFVSAFFPLNGQNVIFSLYVIGILVAILTALTLNTARHSPVESMSLIEMPDYRWPMWSVLLRQVWARLKSFLIKAGILIIALCVIINGLGYEVLAMLGKALTPLFAPIGISAQNWPATVGLITGLIAKEAVIGTLNAFYANEAAMVQSFGGVVAAYSYLLFTLLYFPCVSVVAVISKELNFKWAMFSVVWSTGLAYLIAALFFQIATLNSWAWIIGLSVVLAAFFALARFLTRDSKHNKAGLRLVPTAIELNG